MRLLQAPRQLPPAKTRGFPHLQNRSNERLSWQKFSALRGITRVRSLLVIGGDPYKHL
ncbi:hypothetical protein PAXRUDRAFT_764662 [Paxillus rubicundulus Ve08.2h10]|uniref:Uncharacterized protein n=1 Tax=Paxillus rubicundulus Ve08.2h10 TaxID=930991 RepID=A0A0D0DA28_9AGAM|nr:hypothetical protein PAXRUDRAFT_764662 [Paxillus rubicundulus Ve08.2h10]